MVGLRCAVVVVSLWAASASGAEVVGLQWPDNPAQRAIFAYEAASLRPVMPTAARPTLEERLRAAPFVTGEARVGLDLSTLDAEAAAAIRAAAPQAGSGTLLNLGTWAPVAEKLYGPRRAPRTLAEFKALHGVLVGPDWASVDVRSILTKAKRRIWYDARKVLESTVTAMESGTPLSYPVETWFLTEQLEDDGSLVETHLIGKRADHEMDYLLYDAKGVLDVHSAESNMKSPTTCFACHRNARRLTPFAEFPDAAPPLNGFQPAIEIQLDATQTAIVRAFVMTGPRPDDTHGTYGGIAALRLRKSIADGSAQPWARKLWPRLIKLVPALARRSKNPG